MEIINATANQQLANQSYFLFRGFIAGPVRAIGGVAQAAINLVGLVFLCIPSAGLISPDSKWHVKALFVDECKAILHIFRGVIEFIPGTSFLIDRFEGSGKYVMLESSDLPINGRAALEGSWPCSYRAHHES